MTIFAIVMLVISVLLLLVTIVEQEGRGSFLPFLYVVFFSLYLYM